MATIACENCGLRPATVELRQRTDGAERVLRLCHHCAAAAAAGYGPGPAGSLEGMVEGLMGPRPRGRTGLLGLLSEMAQRVLQRAAREALRRGQARVGVEVVRERAGPRAS